jgi:hypothetical protein
MKFKTTRRKGKKSNFDEKTNMGVDEKRDGI